MGNILILITFGVLAPLLGLAMVSMMVFETVIGQIVVGKFISRNSVVLLSRSGLASTDFARSETEAEEMSINEDAGDIVDGKRKFDKGTPVRIMTEALAEEIEMYEEPFGALSRIEECENILKILPTHGVLYMGRRSFIFAAGVVLAFVLNDIYFNDTNAAPSYIAQIFVLFAGTGIDSLISSSKKIFKYLGWIESVDDKKDGDSKNSNSPAGIHTNPLHAAQAGAAASYVGNDIEMSVSPNKAMGNEGEF